jgi:hypothetical protein
VIGRLIRRAGVELLCAAVWLYAQFLRRCVASTDQYIRAAHADGITGTRSLQAWTIERDKEQRTIARLDIFRALLRQSVRHAGRQEDGCEASTATSTVAQEENKC